MCSGRKDFLLKPEVFRTRDRCSICELYCAPMLLLSKFELDLGFSSSVRSAHSWRRAQVFEYAPARFCLVQYIRLPVRLAIRICVRALVSVPPSQLPILRRFHHRLLAVNARDPAWMNRGRFCLQQTEEMRGLEITTVGAAAVQHNVYPQEELSASQPLSC